MPTRRILALALPALLALCGRPAAAQEVLIEIDEDLAQQLGMDPDELRDQLDGAMSADLKLDGQSEFLAQMSRANLMSMKGMGADYASNPQRFVLGGSVGTAVNSAGARFGRGDEGLPSGGFAFQAAILAGLNFGAFTDNDKSAARRFVLYVDGMTANTQLEPFRAKFLNLGTHLQIKLVGSAGDAKAVEWGGLDLTGGYELSHYELDLHQPLPVPSGDLTWDADGTLSVVSDGSSVPIELSSNLRLVVATLFLGGAADLHMRSEAASEISLGGPIQVDVEGEERKIGDAEVRLENRGGEVDMTGRIFGGAQVELWVVKVYGHLNVGFDNSFGGHLGLRVAM